MSPTRKALQSWLATKEAHGVVLDIGGDIWSAKATLKQCTGVYETADETTFDLNISEPRTGRYDVVLCLEVMQFVYAPYRAICTLRESLKKGGILYISFHFSHPLMNSHDYLRYTKEGAYKILTAAGLHVQECAEPLPGYFLFQCCRL